MRVLFDSSVIIPALVPVHPRHSLCLPHLQATQQRQTEAYLSTHSLSEVYSILTRLPVNPRPTPQQAEALIADLLGYVVPAVLATEDYLQAIAQMVCLGLPGGGIFDALIAQAALKAQVECRLFTLHPDDVNRLSPKIAALVQVPGS